MDSVMFELPASSSWLVAEAVEMSSWHLLRMPNYIGIHLVDGSQKFFD